MFFFSHSQYKETINSVQIVLAADKLTLVIYKEYPNGVLQSRVKIVALEQYRLPRLLVS